MLLKVIGSSSSGNCYILDAGQESMILEAGVSFPRIQQALNFDLTRVSGCLVSHGHGDHCKGARGVLKAGIRLYASGGTHDEMKTGSMPGAKILQATKQERIGSFHVMPFDLEHDTTAPLGFLIRHPDCGVICFLTDSFYSRWKFPGVNHWMIEANYSDEKMRDPRFIRDRTISSHMSLDTCADLLRSSDLSQTRSVTLIHLSDRNSDAIAFREAIQGIVGVPVHVAAPGLVVNLHKNAF